MVKNLPAMQETWVRFLGQEDSLEKGMATHCSILAWRIPWTEEPGGLQSMGSQRARHNWATNANPCPLIWLPQFCHYPKGFVFFFEPNPEFRKLYHWWKKWVGGWELSVLQQGEWVLGELARVKAEEIPTPLPPVFTCEPFFLPLFPSSPQFGRKPASQPSAGDDP